MIVSSRQLISNTRYFGTMISCVSICIQLVSFHPIWMHKWELVSRTLKTWASDSKDTSLRCELNKCKKISDSSSGSNTMPLFQALLHLSGALQIKVTETWLTYVTLDTRIQLIPSCKMYKTWIPHSMHQNNGHQLSREVKTRWPYKRLIMLTSQHTITVKARCMNLLQPRAFQQKCKSIQLQRWTKYDKAESCETAVLPTSALTVRYLSMEETMYLSNREVQVLILYQPNNHPKRYHCSI